jgi:hypothetical protein
VPFSQLASPPHRSCLLLFESNKSFETNEFENLLRPFHRTPCHDETDEQFSTERDWTVETKQQTQSPLFSLCLVEANHQKTETSCRSLRQPSRLLKLFSTLIVRDFAAV